METLNLGKLPKGTMYHIMYDLEARFRSLSEVGDYVLKSPILYPRIPNTCSLNEDYTTPRVCVAPSIEDCVTSIGVFGFFRRCANTAEDSFSYENDNEVYPILVFEFAPSNRFYKPSVSEVADVEYTNEYWSTIACVASRLELCWLDQFSVDYHLVGEKAICTKVNFVSNVLDKNHPWLNGKGHPLNCSDMGRDPWPHYEDFYDNLYLDQRSNTLVHMVPDVPFNGYGTVYPIDRGEEYRCALFDCKKFTGFVDRVGEPIFDGSYCDLGSEHNQKVVMVKRDSVLGWVFEGMILSRPIVMGSLFTQSFSRFAMLKDVKVLNKVRIKDKYQIFD